MVAPHSTVPTHKQEKPPASATSAAIPSQAKQPNQRS